MKVDYLSIPELADKRHIIIDGRRIVNTAARPSGIIHLFDRGRPREEIESNIVPERTAEAPR